MRSGDDVLRYLDDASRLGLHAGIEYDLGVATEINEASGVPLRAFLGRAHARGARFSVGSDSHFALVPLDRTEAMIREAGVADGPFLDGRRAQDGVSSATSS